MLVVLLGVRRVAFEVERVVPMDVLSKVVNSAVLYES